MYIQYVVQYEPFFFFFFNLALSYRSDDMLCHSHTPYLMRIALLRIVVCVHLGFFLHCCMCFDCFSV